MRAVLLFALLGLLSASTQGQNLKYKSLDKYYQGNQQLSLLAIKETMQVNPAAFALISKAESHRKLSTILWASTAAFVGYGLYLKTTGYIYDSDQSKKYFIPGLGLGVMASAFRNAAEKKAKAAVATFNQKPTGMYELNPSFQLGFMDSGLGLQVHF